MYGVTEARRGEIRYLSLFFAITAIMCEEYFAVLPVIEVGFFNLPYTIVFCSQLYVKLCQFKPLGRKIPFSLSAWAFMGKMTKMFQLSPRYFEGKNEHIVKMNR